MDNYYIIQDFSVKTHISIRTLETLEKEGVLSFKRKTLKTKCGSRNTRIVYKNEIPKVILYIFATKFFCLDVSTGKNLTERKAFAELFSTTFKQNDLEKAYDKIQNIIRNKTNVLYKIEKAIEDNDYKNLLEMAENLQQNKYNLGENQNDQKTPLTNKNLPWNKNA